MIKTEKLSFSEIWRR